jgi:cell wall-associated NlpC family hydrolase
MFARISLVAFTAGLLVVASAHADDEPALVLQESKTLLQQATSSVETTLDKALDLLGIRYRRGGVSPETGFDCSGFVSHVFHEGLGLELPHSAREMSKTGDPVTKDELQPGDLVFFNTMRRAFSHVGIYLGDNLFVHAPRRGSFVRIEDMSARYWTKRFNGARRVADQ